jgi:1-acyl-sn-glycerol-3-phosphate acyltransferase
MLRVAAVGFAFVVMTMALAAAFIIVRAFGLPGRGTLSRAYSSMLCRLLGVRVHRHGAPVAKQPVLLLANHASWLDILVLTAVAPVIFVAKSEIARWPLVGAVARLRPTIFVDRSRRQQTGDVNARIARHLADGEPVVLFAEGTSSDGNRVLPFRSALVGAAQQVLAEDPARPHILLQPLSIGYTRINGLPLGRRHRPLVAWYGDVDFLPHLVQFLRHGAIDAVVTFGEPLAYDGADRKQTVKSLESTVRRLTSAALRSAPAPRTASHSFFARKRLRGDVRARSYGAESGVSEPL